MALFRNKNCGTPPATRGAPRIVCLLLLLFACVLLAQGCGLNISSSSALIAKGAANDAEAAKTAVDEAIKNNDAEAAYENLLLVQYHIAVAEEAYDTREDGSLANSEPGNEPVTAKAYADAKSTFKKASEAFNKAFPDFDSIAYEAQKPYATYADEQVLALLFPETPTDDTDLENPTTLAGRLDIKTLGDALGSDPFLPRPDTIATVIGNLAATTGGGMSANGIYGFNVNLISGNITGGTMAGDYGSVDGVYALTGGTGTLVGNNFEVQNFQGHVENNTDVSGSYLRGTGSDGFKIPKTLVTGGTFDLKDSNGHSYLDAPGTITDGSRTQ